MPDTSFKFQEIKEYKALQWVIYFILKKNKTSNSLQRSQALFQYGLNCTTRGSRYDFSLAVNLVEMMLMEHCLQAALGVMLKQATYSMLNN